MDKVGASSCFGLNTYSTNDQLEKTYIVTRLSHASIQVYAFLRSMYDAACEWAKARNLWRVNPIHKEEEIKVVVEDFFKYGEETGWESEQRGTFEMEDIWVFLLLETLCFTICMYTIYDF